MGKQRIQSGGVTPQSFDEYVPSVNYQPTTRKSQVQQGAELGGSKYDKGMSYVYGQDVNESRAQRQTTADKAFNGIGKGVGLAGTTFLETFTALPVGLVMATGKYVTGESFSDSLNSLYDNPVSQAYDRFNQNMEEWLPNYYTEAERNATAFSSDNWFTSNFLFDKLIKNAGFTVGAIGSGAVVSKGLYGMSKLMMAGRFAKESAAVNNLIQRGYTVEQALAKVGSGLKTADKAVKFGSAMAAAAGEGSIEARGAKDETLNHLIEEYKKANNGEAPSEEKLAEFDSVANAAGNTVFAANLAILGTSDLIQFGKFLGTGYKNELKQMASVSSDVVVKNGIARGKKFGRVANAINVAKGPVKGMITEASEEGGQFTSTEFARSYETRKYDGTAKDQIDNLIHSMADGLGKTFGTKDGLESMLLGALTGVGSRVATGEIMSDIRANKERDLNIERAVAQLNSYKAGSIFKPAYDSAIETVSIATDMRNAIKNGDIYAYKNLQNDYFKSYVASRIETGRFDLLLEELEDLKGLNPQEFASTFGIDKISDNENLVNQYVDKLVKKAKQIEKVSSDVDIRFNKVSPVLKKYLYSNIVDINDANSRMEELSLEVANISQKAGKAITPHGLAGEYGKEFVSHLNAELDNLDKTNKHIADEIRPLIGDYMKLINKRAELLDMYAQLSSVKGEKVVAKKEKEAAKTPEEKKVEAEKKEEKKEAKAEKEMTPEEALDAEVVTPTPTTSARSGEEAGEDWDEEDEAEFQESQTGGVAHQVETQDNLDDDFGFGAPEEAPTTVPASADGFGITTEKEGEEAGITEGKDEQSDDFGAYVPGSATPEEKAPETKKEEPKPEPVVEKKEEKKSADKSGKPVIKGDAFYTSIVKPATDNVQAERYEKVASMLDSDPSKVDRIQLRIHNEWKGSGITTYEGSDVAVNKETPINVEVSFINKDGTALPFGYMLNPNYFINKVTGQAIKMSDYTNDQLREMFDFPADMTDEKLQSLKDNHDRAIKLMYMLSERFKKEGPFTTTLGEFKDIVKPSVTSSYVSADYTDRPAMKSLKGFNHNGEYYIYDLWDESYTTGNYPKDHAITDAERELYRDNLDARYLALYKEGNKMQWIIVKPQIFKKAQLTDMVVKINQAANLLKKVDPKYPRIEEGTPEGKAALDAISALNEYFIAAEEDTIYKFEAAYRNGEHILQVVVRRKIVVNGEPTMIRKRILIGNVESIDMFVSRINTSMPKDSEGKFDMPTHVSPTHIGQSTKVKYPGMPSPEVAAKFDSTIKGVANRYIRLDVADQKVEDISAGEKLAEKITPVVPVVAVEEEAAPVVDPNTMSDMDFNKYTMELMKKGVDKATVSKMRADRAKFKASQKGDANLGNALSGETPVASVGRGAAKKIIDMTAAREWFRRNLPEAFDVQDIERVIDKLEVNGVLFGAYADKVAYLSRRAEEGTQYHEAFHAVFRALLTDSQINKYYMLEREISGDPTLQEIEDLMNRVPQTVDLTIEEIENLVLEERMADRFMDYANEVNPKKVGLFRSLFNRIKRFLANLFKNRNAIDRLFSDINSGAFKQSVVKQNMFSRASFAYKLIAVKEEGISMDLNTSNQIITDIASKISSRPDVSITTVRDLINKELDIRVMMYDPMHPAHSKAMEDPVYFDTIMSYSDVFNSDKARQIIKEEVVVRLLPILKREDLTDEDVEEELNEIGERNWEKDIYENGGFETVNKEIKNFIKYTSYQTEDEFGISEYEIENEDGSVIKVPIEKAIDYTMTYSSIEMALASTPLEQMLPKLEIMAKYNVQIKAVLDKLRMRTGFQKNESARGGYEFTVPNGELFMNSFIKSFEKEKVNYLHISLDVMSGGENKTQMYAANQRDSKQIVFERWFKAYQGKITKASSGALPREFGSRLIDLGAKYRAGVYETASENEIEAAIREISDAFFNVGIEVPSAIIEISLRGFKSRMDLDGKEKHIKVIHPDVFSTLGRIIREGNNPFQSAVREAGIDTAMTGRLMELADLSAPYMGNVIISSFQGADGKMRYTYIRPSEFIVRNREVSGFLVKEKRDAAIAENLLYADNFYMTHENADEIFSNLEVAFTGDIRNTNRQDGKGVTFRDIDPKAFQVMQHSLFYTPTESSSNTLNYGRFYSMVMESSSTAFATRLPVEYTYYRDGNISDSAMGILYKNIFMTEFKRIKREQQWLKDNKDNKEAHIKNYHTAARGTKFVDLSFLETAMYNDKMSMGDYIRGLSIEDLADNADKIKKVIAEEVKKHIEKEKGDAIKNKVFDKFGSVLALDANRVNIISGYQETDVMEPMGDGTFMATKVPNISTEDRMDNYIGSFVVNNIIANTTINHLILGDAAIFKDDTDVVKRAKGMIASGVSLYSPFTSVSPENSGLSDNQFYAAVIADPVGYVLRETAENHLVGSRILDRDLKRVEDKEMSKDAFDAKWAKIEIADAQSWVTVGKKINDLRALGRVSPDALERLERVKNGDESYVWTSEAEDGFVLNSDKNVYYDNRQVYKKDSEVVLTPLLTSMKDADGNWIARPGREFLHNLRVWMETNGIEKTNTASGSKGRMSHVLVADTNGNLPTPSADQFGAMISSRKSQRLQVETPSGKTQIVYGTQLMQLIDSELDDSQEVSVVGMKSIKNLGELRNAYREMLADSRGRDYAKAIKTIGILRNEYHFTRNDDKFFLRLQETLRESGASESMIEMFAPGSNPNLPHTLAKFEQLFMAQFKSGFKQKVPGLKMALLSPLGFEVVVNNANEIITQGLVDEDVKRPAAERKYLDVNGKLRTDLGYKTRPLKAHRLSENGKEILFGEVMMPLWAKNLYGIEKGADSRKMSPETRDKILTMMGIRIPTQSQHSMIHFKVVDFLPPYYGSTVVVPAEIAYLAGSDFDIDSLFIYRKDYWVDDKTGKFNIFENGKADQDAFNDYRAYNMRDKDVKGTIRDILSNDNDYVTLVERERVAKSILKIYLDKIKEKRELRNEILDLKKIIDEDIVENAVADMELDLPVAGGTPEEVKEFYKTALEDRMMELEVRLRDFVKVTDNVDFDSKVQELKGTLKEYRKLKSDFMAKVQEESLKTNGYASTLEEYLSLDENDKTTNAITNNQLLDIKLAILTHPSTWESARTPASLDKLKEAEKFLFFGVRKQSESAYMRTSSIGLRDSWNNNAVGKKNVGPWANVNSSSAILTRHRVKLVESERVMIPQIDDIRFDSFEYKDELDIVLSEKKNGTIGLVRFSDGGFTQVGAVEIMNQNFIEVLDDATQESYFMKPEGDLLYKRARKADSLSTGVSAMTDNAKERLAAKLNITLKTSSTIAAMESLGMGTMRSTLLSSQESIRAISEKASGGDSAINLKSEAFDVEGSVIETYEKLLAEAYTAWRAEEDTILAANPEHISAELSKVVNPSDLSSPRMLAALYDERSLEDLSLEDKVRYYRVQVAAALFYKNMNEIATDISKVNKVAKLNKGLPTSLSEAEDIYQAAMDLGLGGISSGYEAAFDTRNVVKEDKNMRTNVRRLMQVMDTISKNYFVSQTEFAISLRNEIISTELKETARKSVVEGIDKEIISYLTVRAYESVWNKKYAETRGTLKLSVGDRLIHPTEGKHTLAEDFVLLTRTNERFAANPLVRFLTAELSNYTAGKLGLKGVDKQFIDILSGDTRTKLTPEYENELVDAYRELLDAEKSSDDVVRFAEEMFAYLLVKDNLQFKNKSFINFVAPEMYREIHEGLNMLVTELAKPSLSQRFITEESTDEATTDTEAYQNHAIIREITGMNPAQLKDDFIRRFMRYEGTFRSARSLSPGTLAILEEVEGKTTNVGIKPEVDRDDKNQILSVTFSVVGLTRKQVKFFKPYYAKGGESLTGIKAPRFIMYKHSDKGTAIPMELKIEEQGEDATIKNIPLLRANGSLVGLTLKYVPTTSLGGRDWKILHYRTIADAENRMQLNKDRFGDQEEKLDPNTLKELRELMKSMPEDVARKQLGLLPRAARSQTWQGGYTKMEDALNESPAPQAPSSKVVVDKSLSWGQIMNMPVYSEKGVNTMRTKVKDAPHMHFGNPFTGSGVTGLIQMPDIPTAVQAYVDWLTTDKYADVNPEQKAWIIGEINSGKLSGKTFLYMSEKGSYYSHADALADLVNSGMSSSTTESSTSTNPSPGTDPTPQADGGGFGPIADDFSDDIFDHPYDPDDDEQKQGAGRDISIEEAQMIMDHLTKKLGVKAQMIVDNDAPWAGLFRKGKVFLNMAKLKADTPFHEFAHPLVRVIKINNVPLYERLKSELLNSEEGQVILARVAYLYTDEKGYTQEDRIEEAIVQAIGEYAAETLDKKSGLVAAIKRFLERISQYIAKALNISPREINAGELSGNLTLRDLGSLLGIGNDTKINLDFISEVEQEQSEEEQKLHEDLENLLMELGLLKIICKR